MQDNKAVVNPKNHGEISGFNQGKTRKHPDDIDQGARFIFWIKFALEGEVSALEDALAAGNEEFSASLDDNNYYVFEFESLREAHESHEVNLDPIEFYQAIENFQEEAKGLGLWGQDNLSTEDLEERINKALINTGIKSEYVPEEILTSFKEQLRNLWLESIEVARYNSLFDTEDFSGETGLAENSQIEEPDNQEIEKSNNAPPELYHRTC